MMGHGDGLESRVPLDATSPGLGLTGVLWPEMTHEETERSLTRSEVDVEYPLTHLV